MSLDYAREAIENTLPSGCRIGMMGGAPTLHPQFRDMLDLWRELVPLDRREFWTTSFKWAEYEADIKDTFRPELIHFNDHTAYDGKHAPLLVAIEEVVDDPVLRKQLIDNCPYQSHWSASVTPKGGFFCEIAASLDWLLDGPGGYDMEPGWWNKTPDQFQDQVERYCGLCSGAIPQPPLPIASDARGGRDDVNKDLMSPGMVERLMAQGSPKVMRGGFEIWDKKITAQDIPDDPRNPREYRTFEAHDPEQVPKEMTVDPNA
jgi:hypothetical protein